MSYRDDPPATPPCALFAFVLWAVAMTALLISFGGCASPGGAGFKEMARSNALERKALKAVAINTDGIGKHTAAADALAVKLEATKLTSQQAQWLDQLRVELKATQAEKDALVLKVAEIGSLIDQRDATIRQTKREVAAAVSTAWWSGFKFVLYAGLALFVGLSLLGVLFRVSLRAGLIAASSYPPVAAALRVLPAK